MIYSSRLKKILHYCLQHQDVYVRLDELCDLLKISKRTIFRELKNIDQDLESYDLKLINTSGKGIRIEGSLERKKELLEELTTQGIEYINKEERQNLLKFELLRSLEITKLLHYANMFQVSEATISNDLDAMEEWFIRHKLKLVRKPGLGVEVLGNERDMRQAMTSLLHESLQKDQSYNDVNYLDSQTLLQQIFAKDDGNSIMRLLNQEILKRILHVFHMYQHELSLDRYTQSSYIGLIIHLVIAIERILKHEEIADNEQVLAMIREDVSFLQAEKMAQCLELEFDIDIPETEIAFIALHIKGAKISRVDYHDTLGEVDVLSSLVSKILNSYDEEKRIQLLQDEELIHGLLTHLEPTIIRLKNQLPIYNPLLSQIKEMYHDLFEQTKRACTCIEETYHCVVSDDEIGFITMHVGASLERNKGQVKRSRDVSIAIACASGIGVSALLSARIAKAFPYGVQMKTISMEEILRGDDVNCEVLVSTFPLEDISCISLCVSPLLSNEDIQNLRQIIERLQKTGKKETIKPTKDFMNQVKTIRNICGYIEEITDHLYVSNLRSDVTIQDILHRIALDHGNDEQTLYEDLYQREQLGSVIMNDYGFAMYHTKSKAVDESIIHIYYADDHMFQDSTLIHVNFIIAMLSPDKQDQERQNLLSAVSRALIEKETFIETIQSKDQTKIKQELIDIVKEYFITYLEDEL